MEERKDGKQGEKEIEERRQKVGIREETKETGFGEEGNL